MLKEVTIQGFKSFKDKITIPLSPLTVFTGMNSSGKSSIIQAIQILNNLTTTSDIERAIPDGHGNLNELINSASKPEDLWLELCTQMMSISYKERKKTLSGHSNDLFLYYMSADRFGPRTSIPITKGLLIDSKGDNILKILDNIGENNLNESIQYSKEGKKTLLANLKTWINEISPGTDFNYKIQSKSDSSYTLFNNYRANNVGFGLSYTLPVITLLLASTLSKIPTVVILENPEAHLHPRGQSKIAELICLVAQSGVQVILETHSDHIINGIRVSSLHHEKGLSGIDRKNVGIFHVTQLFDEIDGYKSEIHPIVIENGGKIYDAPEGFFDQFNFDRRELLGF